MRHFITSMVLVFLTQLLFAQPWVQISLITDRGVKTAEYLHFSISNETSVSHDFTYDEFSNNGEYLNTNLYSYHKVITTGVHEMSVVFKTDIEHSIIDTLLIDSTTSRVEIFILISTTDSIGDFIREIKILKYQVNPNFIRFHRHRKPKIGSGAMFSIKNIGDKEIYGYPNNGFFFGTLYEEISSEVWIQHYPRYIDIKYCDTVSSPKPLIVGQTTKTWTPNHIDCSVYNFEKRGNYYYELLYSTTGSSFLVFKGSTKLSKIDIYRQIMDVKL